MRDDFTQTETEGATARGMVDDAVERITFVRLNIPACGRLGDQHHASLSAGPAQVILRTAYRQAACGDHRPPGAFASQILRGGTYSGRTRDQSHSSSSATSIGNPVRLPCPISERAKRMVTVSSGSIATQTVISDILPIAVGVAAFGEEGCPLKTMTPAAADIPNAKERRLMAGPGWLMAIPSSGPRGGGRRIRRVRGHRRPA